MLDYGWYSPSSQMTMTGDDSSTNRILVLDDHHNQPDDHHARRLYVDDPYAFSLDGVPTASSSGIGIINGMVLQHPASSSTPSAVDYHYYYQYGQFHHHHHLQQSHFGQSVLDPLTGETYPPAAPVAEVDPGSTTGFMMMMMPANEPAAQCPILTDHYANPIGLNLGRRTYFSTDDDFISQLYRRSRMSDCGFLNTPRCQAEGCNADLSHAKHYHRRHKVCEIHSKASTVVAGGLTQRFCQQCSRFHLLTEFDNGKRSCRRRLADHNRRRRKSHQSSSQDARDSHAETTKNSPSDQNVSRSPSDSGVQSSSSVTVPVSPQQNC